MYYSVLVLYSTFLKSSAATYFPEINFNQVLVIYFKSRQYYLLGLRGIPLDGISMSLNLGKLIVVKDLISIITEEHRHPAFDTEDRYRAGHGEYDPLHDGKPCRMEMKSLIVKYCNNLSSNSDIYDKYPTMDIWQKYYP